ncbi:hypothetical protein [Pantoea sp. KPR_PJ]|uniref:hypothetical protein n=1 Tax=Pantoea sp. KPR_PJ TaxID=2738375 RepID=UPI003528C280
MQIANVYNLEMDSDYFYNSDKYGVMCLDTSVAGAATFTDLMIKSATFRNITSDGVHLYPNATIGNVHVINPVFNGAPLDNSLNRSMYIGKTGNSKLVIAGAKNIGTNIPAAYDASTCYNVDIYDNKPEIVQIWNPVLSGQDGTPTGSVTATFNKKGDTIFFEATIRITTVNNAGNPIFTIPYPAKPGAIANIIGRTESSGDNVGAGKMLLGLIQTDSNNVRMLNFDNSRSLANLVAPVVMRVSGYYRTP